MVLAGSMTEFDVLGIPAPQGSKTVFNGRAVDSNAEALHEWRARCTGMARQFVRGGRPVYEQQPLLLEVTFRLARPASAPKHREYPQVKPDLDKLIRAVCDALTVSRLIQDDALICRIVTEKLYARPPARPGATIRIGVWA
jgi:Holliday junction resolvase RusA-like endonuclease